MILELKKTFRKLSVRELQINELDIAERELLEAKTARDYADAIVRYNEMRIARLSKSLGCMAKAQEKLHEIAN